jgi:hypothetical protein
MILLLVQWLYMPIAANLLNILLHQTGNPVRLVSISTFELKVPLTIAWLGSLPGEHGVIPIDNYDLY